MVGGRNKANEEGRKGGRGKGSARVGTSEGGRSRGGNVILSLDSALMLLFSALLCSRWERGHRIRKSSHQRS